MLPTRFIPNRCMPDEAGFFENHNTAAVGLSFWQAQGDHRQLLPQRQNLEMETGATSELTSKD